MFKKNIWPLILFILLLLGMSGFLYLPIMIFNLDYGNFTQSMKIIYTFCCDIIFMLIVFLIYRKTFIRDIKKYFKDFKENFSTSFKYYFIGLIIMYVSNLLISFFFSEANANNETAIRNLMDVYPLYMLFSVAIYAPFIEEIIFRKNIFDCVVSFRDNKFTRYLYVLISGLIFASLHVLGMTNTYLDYLYIIPYSSLGIAFALLYNKTGNIFCSISMHAMHNIVAAIGYFMI